MKVQILKECGYEEALLGLSLSYDKPVEDMPRVAVGLYSGDDSESKFLRQIVVWLDITAPRYWWCQMDTYTVGKTQQSESTMHTILKGLLTQENFEGEIALGTLVLLNHYIKWGKLKDVKRELPESFLQRRIVCCNYQVLRRMISQRKGHELIEWDKFIAVILRQIGHKEFFEDLPKGVD